MATSNHGIGVETSDCPRGTRSDGLGFSCDEDITDEKCLKA